VNSINTGYNYARVSVSVISADARAASA